MTPEQQKEEISKAYIHALAARNGFKLANWTQDGDCLDVTIGADGQLGGGALASPKVDLQLKCTSDQGVLHPEFVSWTLEKPHYDRLRKRSAVPKLLVVLVLPDDETAWITHSVDELIIRRCAFWVRTNGMPDIDPGQQSKTVRLPRAQVFSPAALKEMMEKLSREEEI